MTKFYLFKRGIKLIVGLRGKIFKLETNYLHLDTGSVVYEIFISFKTFDILKDNTNKEIFLYIFHSITERNQKLFGFLNEKDKSLFELLRSLSGIGEMTALRVLSFFTGSQLLEIVQTNDVKMLEKIPKVRGKTSQKIIFEIKQNIKKFELLLENEKVQLRSISMELELAIQALIQLGYDQKTASKEVSRVTSLGISSVPDIIREVLKSN